MSAIFSSCRTWRYTLTRHTENKVACDCMIEYLEGVGNHSPSCAIFKGRTVAFIGLNPSTADEVTDDPTVRRCIGFAQRWGFERMVMLNAFAYRATDPARLGGLDFSTAVGPENNQHIAREAHAADLVVCAWGVHGARWQRGVALHVALASSEIDLHVLGLTKGGHPRHPLYLRRDVEPVPWLIPE